MDISRRQSMTRRLSSWRRSLSLTGHSANQGYGTAHIPPENRTMFQGFEWYSSPTATASHWKRLIAALPYLRAIGIDKIWLPPGCKAANPKGNGYDIYDLYDLGEFDQKGSRATKWGTKEELVELCQTAKRLGVGVIWDAVLNHKAAGDARERCQAVKVNPKDRRKEISAPADVEVWTKFDFAGRGAKYSSMKYNWHHFSGIDYDASRHSNAIYKFVGDKKPGWATDVDGELGNYDYRKSSSPFPSLSSLRPHNTHFMSNASSAVMFADLDYSQPAVRHDVFNWSSWITEELSLSGLRLDAMKHYSQDFQRELVSHLDSQFGRDFFFVGEYWTWDSYVLSSVIGKFKGRISLFDVQLVYNLSEASMQKRGDLRKVFDGALVQLHPQRAVTFVANHDTQEFQSLPAPVEEWFVPHAYALILLRAEGLPCVFYGDLYGTAGPRPRRPAAGGRLARLIAARKHYAYGKQRDYFDQEDCIGWTRVGHASKSEGAGVAVLLNSSWEVRWKRMGVGAGHRGETWTDIMGWHWGDVVIDEFGEGRFPVGPRSISVWTRDKAPGRDKIDRLVHDRIPDGEEKGRK